MLLGRLSTTEGETIWMNGFKVRGIKKKEEQLRLNSDFRRIRGNRGKKTKEKEAPQKKKKKPSQQGRRLRNVTPLTMP